MIYGVAYIKVMHKIKREFLWSLAMAENSFEPSIHVLQTFNEAELSLEPVWGDLQSPPNLFEGNWSMKISIFFLA